MISFLLGLRFRSPLILAGLLLSCVPEDEAACCGGEGCASASTVEAGDHHDQAPGVWREGTTERGTYAMRWRPSPDPIPDNEPCRLQVEVSAGGAPVDDVELHVHAWMPAHRHGMVRNPVATSIGDGGYEVRGMLFHMPGHWQLFFDVIRDGELERATFELELP